MERAGLANIVRKQREVFNKPSCFEISLSLLLINRLLLLDASHFHPPLLNTRIALRTLVAFVSGVKRCSSMSRLIRFTTLSSNRT